MKIYRTFDEMCKDIGEQDGRYVFEIKQAEIEQIKQQITKLEFSEEDAQQYALKCNAEIEQLKKVISGFEKMMAANVLTPNDEYESLIATIKKAYNPSYIIDTNQTIVKLVKNTEQLKARILELEKEADNMANAISKLMGATE